MKIKKDDKVKVISGEYIGVEGHVLKSFPKTNKIIVEKVNFMKKHQRPTQQNPSGGVIEMEAPIHVSNIQFICPKCGKPSKVKMKVLDDKSRIRYCTKCGDMV
ncbi:MAG: 50S ribosomal protein L24 [Candidatus Celaenobacter antarcticus]|nr:50S ribosomal protein L24 [Candidatus Celaenobacter antarcticus]MDP8315692.1 50S ribosomal protein L24 [Candidatus Celaenobacter antarcticus]